VTVDNLMSEKHTVFQIRTRDRKGLLYDVLRASKDLEVKVNYAKVEMRDGDARRGRGGDRNSGSSRETRLGGTTTTTATERADICARLTCSSGGARTCASAGTCASGTKKTWSGR